MPSPHFFLWSSLSHPPTPGSRDSASPSRVCCVSRWSVTCRTVSTLLRSFLFALSALLIPLHSFLFAHSSSLFPLRSYLFAHSSSLFPLHSFLFAHSSSLIHLRYFLFAHSSSLIPLRSFPFAHSSSLLASLYPVTCVDGRLQLACAIYGCPRVCP
jgi:hypothetical protein